MRLPTHSHLRSSFLPVRTLAALLLLGANAVAQTSIHANPAGFADLEIVDSLEVGVFIPPVAKSNMAAPRPAGEAVVRKRMENGKILSVSRAAPSSLPDLAVIRAEPERMSPDSAGQERGDTIPHEEKQRFLSLGATVIDRRVSHVTWVDSTGKTAQALCGFDISLLAGLAHFRKGDTHYSILLMHGHHDSRSDGRFFAEDFADTTPVAGEIILPAGTLDAGDETLGDLRRLSNLIEREKASLLQFQKARSARQEAGRRWHEANPAPPEDEHVVLRPHSGSRYLREPGEDKSDEAKGEGDAK